MSGIFLGAIVGAALWSIILGFFVAPWLVLAGGVVLAAVLVVYPPLDVEDGSPE